MPLTDLVVNVNLASHGVNDAEKALKALQKKQYLSLPAARIFGILQFRSAIQGAKASSPFAVAVHVGR